ncbi:MAG: hypothetical protein ACKPJJ_13910 [Planctomycetaceae bacterium]
MRLRLISIYLIGLEYRSPAGRTMFDEYNSFMDELTSFSQVVYGYSPCMNDST